MLVSFQKVTYHRLCTTILGDLRTLLTLGMKFVQHHGIFLDGEDLHHERSRLWPCNVDVLPRLLPA
jgi:hypothetical protein